MGYYSNLSIGSTWGQATDERDGFIAPAATPTRATLAAPDMSAMSPAYRIGFWDGLQQEPCCPEMYFAAPSRIASYMLGFLTAQPGNIIALTRWQQFLDADAADRLAEADHYQFVTGLGR